MKKRIVLVEDGDVHHIPSRVRHAKNMSTFRIFLVLRAQSLSYVVLSSHTYVIQLLVFVVETRMLESEIT